MPQLKATMAGLIRRIAARQIVPRSARAQDPEDGPLHIGEIHAPKCSKKKLPLGALIVHLNGAHHWTRERIAAWVGRRPRRAARRITRPSLMGHFR